MMKISQYLSTPVVSWLIAFIAISCRVISILYGSFISRDKVFLALQSKSFLNGRGFSIPQYFSSDLINPINDLTPRWPPGYPLLLSPFLKIFDYDMAAATTAIDLIGGIIIIYLARKIAIQLKFPTAAVNIFTLIAGCFEYAFITEALPTDIPSFAFFLGGLLILLQAMQKENLQISRMIAGAVFLFLPCTFRYAYPPLSIAVPIALILIGWYLNKKSWIKKGFLAFVIISLLLISFFIFIKVVTGSAGYIVNTERGFYPEDILNTAPIVPGSFLNTSFTITQLVNTTGLSPIQSLSLLAIVNGIMILASLVIFLYLFFYKNFFAKANPFKSFLLVGIIISIATFTSLGYLSVTNKPQQGWGNYLGEPRYFMFVSFFLQIAFVGWMFLYNEWRKNIFQKIVVVGLSILLFIEVSHNLYFYSKVALKHEQYQTAQYEEADYTYFINMLNSLRQENPGTGIVVVAESDEFFPLMAGYLDHKGLFDGQNLDKTFPSVKKKTIFIFALYDPELATYQAIFDSHKATLISRVNNVNFYRLDLLP